MLLLLAIAAASITLTQIPAQWNAESAQGQASPRREPRDVDLVLGQGMLRSGWDAHNLNAPGKFLVSASGHDRPKRARAYLLADDVVATTAAHYARNRPRLDYVSLRAIDSASRPNAPSGGSEPVRANSRTTARAAETADDALWLALRAAPEEGTEIGELMRITGWKRTKLYRHLRQHADAGRAIRVSGGRWRVDPRGPDTVTDRPGTVPSRPSRARLHVTRLHGRQDGRDGHQTWHSRTAAHERPGARGDPAGWRRRRTALANR